MKSIQSLDIYRNYNSFGTEIKEFEDLRRGIIRKLNANKSLTSRVYQRTRESLDSLLLKKKNYTLMKLYDLQINKISGLAARLEELNEREREGLKEIEEYNDYINREFLKSLDRKGYRSERLAKDFGEYENIKRELQRTKRGGKERFLLEDRLRKKYRWVKRHKQKIQLNEDKIMDLGGERIYLDQFEGLLRTSLYYGERLEKKMGRVERSCHNTKDKYEIMIDKQRIIFTLIDEQNLIGQLILQVQNILAEGMEKIGLVLETKEGFYDPKIIRDVRRHLPSPQSSSHISQQGQGI